MTVGIQLTSAIVDQQITEYAVALRELMKSINGLSMNVNGQNNGLAVLQAAGYSAGDAQTALNAISYLNTISSLYYGTATQTSPYNFHQQLSQYWGGR